MLPRKIFKSTLSEMLFSAFIHEFLFKIQFRARCKTKMAIPNFALLLYIPPPPSCSLASNAGFLFLIHGKTVLLQESREDLCRPCPCRFVFLPRESTEAKFSPKVILFYFGIKARRGKSFLMLATALL